MQSTDEQNCPNYSIIQNYYLTSNQFMKRHYLITIHSGLMNQITNSIVISASHRTYRR